MSSLIILELDKEEKYNIKYNLPNIFERAKIEIDLDIKVKQGQIKEIDKKNTRKNLQWFRINYIIFLMQVSIIL